ncbi:NADH-quinone oxidoreductase subunit A [Runella sp. MFBS21]|uniref:NADH-quinone oxidoreductase subunit A n=1 Tax=Runella sp. MFBS21 TaxID=3034018 RepID=UPI0023F618AE|nr:NADH-quinone oxidoreductase subunit A [Runella sp. MFBS21]MDF7821755.1 NADH-quinone oxidoreductase subunit A [Runella sp. MFBS21]
MLSEFGTIFLFILTAIVLIISMLGIAKLLRPTRPNEEKLSTYESGEDPLGNANIPFNIRFYVVALVFLLFEVELIFLFPWAVVFGQANLIEQTDGLWGWFSLTEMLIFVGILALGLAYAWAKGYLDWIRPQPKVPEVESKVPMSLYQQINEKYSHKK